ncbi:MAG: hypothetical protein ABSH49_36810 [Bryobacteraceae bacterium]|jgi:hypothetical protein
MRYRKEAHYNTEPVLDRVTDAPITDRQFPLRFLQQPGCFLGRLRYGHFHCRFMVAAFSWALFVSAFDGGLECFTGFFAVSEDACKPTASFARVTAAFAC